MSGHDLHMMGRQGLSAASEASVCSDKCPSGLECSEAGLPAGGPEETENVVLGSLRRDKRSCFSRI